LAVRDLSELVRGLSELVRGLSELVRGFPPVGRSDRGFDPARSGRSERSEAGLAARSPDGLAVRDLSELVRGFPLAGFPAGGFAEAPLEAPGLAPGLAADLPAGLSVGGRFALEEGLRLLGRDDAEVTVDPLRTKGRKRQAAEMTKATRR
jgi:hypothetical protein